VLSGDEAGRTQGGNNNAYCQDNEISWIDWQLDPRRRALLDFTRRVIRFRSEQPVLERRRHFRGQHLWDSEWKDLAWFRPDGTEMEAKDWEGPLVKSLAFLLGGDAIPTPDERGRRIRGEALYVLISAHDEPVEYAFPSGEWGPEWQLAFDTSNPDAPEVLGRPRATFRLNARSLAVFRNPI